MTCPRTDWNIETVMNNESDLFRKQLSELPFVKRQLLRQLAVERLKDFCHGEIGSSDISNQLFSMWRDYGKNFDAILNDHWIEA